MKIHTLCIVGAGLIGASIGLAARRRGVAGRVLGVGRQQAGLDRARERGAIDEALLEMAPAVARADLTVFCTPVDGIGGQVYRGPAYPLLHGAYLYGDFCSGRIWAAARDASGAWQTTEMLQISGALIGSFGEDETGELYVTDIVNGVIYRIVAT